MCARGRVWWGRNKRYDIVVEPRLVQYIHTFGEPAAHIRVLNYAGADDALGSGRKSGCRGHSKLLGDGGLACDRWRGACLEGGFPCSVSSSAQAEEGPRPLQAAARRRLELPGVLGRGFTLCCCGSGCMATFSSSLILSSSLESPADFSHYEAHTGRIFLSGRDQPSSLLVECGACPFATRWGRCKNYRRQHTESSPYKVS